MQLQRRDLVVSILKQGVCACGLVAPTLAFIGLLWKALRNFQFELQVRFACVS